MYIFELALKGFTKPKIIPKFTHFFKFLAFDPHDLNELENFKSTKKIPIVYLTYLKTNAHYSPFVQMS